jgi:hypothetical protein
VSREHPGAAEASEALDVLEAFREALIRGDDLMAWSLLYPPHAERMGFRIHGVADGYLAALGLTRDELERRRPSLTARIWPATEEEPAALIAFGWVDPPSVGWATVGVIDAPTPAVVLALIWTPHGWRIWGQPSPEAFRNAEEVQIPPPAAGPGH